MQFPGEGKPALGIAFDSDIGNSVDDVLALGLLYGFDSKKPTEARLISISVTKSNLKAAGFCEAVDRFYTTITNRQIPERFRRNNPPAIGLSLDGKMAADTPLLTEPLSKRNEEGKPLYPHEVEKITDTADAAALIRNALTAQHDQNAAAVLSGPATNLAAVLDLHGAKEIIVAKVRVLAVAAGAYPEGSPEAAIVTDIAAARKLFAEWPTPIVAVGPEIGEQLLYPASSIENDFGWTASHPIVDAYRAFRPMPYDAPTTALAAALYAVRPDSGYFQLSEPGTISVLDDGSTRFTPSPDGNHRHLIFNPEKREELVKTYTEIVSAEPPPRDLPRFLQRLLDEEKKKEEEQKRQEQQEQQEQQKQQQQSQ
jgi:inosine-uridine nucleoside N-ribohydrolase